MNPPAQESLKGEFAWESQKGQTRQQRRENRKAYYAVSDRLKKVKTLLRKGGCKEVVLLDRLQPEGGAILDIGCAYGRTLGRLNQDRWTPSGIEPSPGLAAQAHEFCSERGGRVLKATAVEGLPQFEENSFQAVLMRSFLEHEVHAEDVLSGVYRVLASGGCSLIKVPNAACWNAKLRGKNWPGVRHPDHVNYFTPRHLHRLIDKVGFERVHFPLSWRLPTSDNMWVAVFKG